MRLTLDSWLLTLELWDVGYGIWNMGYEGFDNISSSWAAAGEGREFTCSYMYTYMIPHDANIFHNGIMEVFISIISMQGQSDVVTWYWRNDTSNQRSIGTCVRIVWRTGRKVVMNNILVVRRVKLGNDNNSNNDNDNTIWIFPFGIWFIPSLRDHKKEDFHPTVEILPPAISSLQPGCNIVKMKMSTLMRRYTMSLTDTRNKSIENECLKRIQKNQAHWKF